MTTKSVKTLGIRQNNPGNIERVKGVRWQGQAADQPHERFLSFESPEWGIRAICRILITYQDKRQAADGSKIDTIREIVARWAPETENNVDAYWTHVAQVCKIGIDDTLDVYDWNTMQALLEGIIAHENAGYRYPEEIVERGMVLAGMTKPGTVAALKPEAPPPPAKSKTIQAAATTIVTGVAALGGAATVAKDLITENQNYLPAEWVSTAMAVIGIVSVISGVAAWMGRYRIMKEHGV